MKKIAFKTSKPLTLGVELEFQIVDPKTFGLVSRAKDLIRMISDSPYSEKIKPEITQSMIEINSSVHSSLEELYQDIIDMRNFLLIQGEKLGIKFCGGGTHPFQKWKLQKIFPTKRFKDLSTQYKYLSKRATVFGQHVHIGCKNAEDALYLTHALARYVPHFLVITAASPFYQGIDTGYHSSRANTFNDFPQSGVIPFLLNWDSFSTYFYKMRRSGIVKTMKDFYWDIRPKPEFGTVEIRVCDTPLTMEKAVLITAYIQTLSRYLLEERPINITHDLYFIYNYNRFQACRYGFDGELVDATNFQRHNIGQDILLTLNNIQKHTAILNNSSYIDEINHLIVNKENDATQQRVSFKKMNSFRELMKEQCQLWETGKKG